MLWFGHLALAYIVLLLISQFTGLVITSKLLIAVLLGSIAPDIDFITFFIRRKSLKLSSRDSHRRSLPHLPLFWLIAILVLVMIFANWWSVILAFGLGVLTHLLADSIEYGIAWGWPWTNKLFAIRKPVPEKIHHKSTWRYYWHFFHAVYIRGITFWVELSIVAFAIVRIYFVGS